MFFSFYKAKCARPKNRVHLRVFACNLSRPAEVSFLQKPVRWFALQINGLSSKELKEEWFKVDNRNTKKKYVKFIQIQQ